jgi:hypothetical protein
VRLDRFSSFLDKRGRSDLQQRIVKQAQKENLKLCAVFSEHPAALKEERQGKKIDL